MKVTSRWMVLPRFSLTNKIWVPFGRNFHPAVAGTTLVPPLTFLVSPSSWALTYSTGWDDGARKGVVGFPRNEMVGALRRRTLHTLSSWGAWGAQDCVPWVFPHAAHGRPEVEGTPKEVTVLSSCTHCLLPPRHLSPLAQERVVGAKRPRDDMGEKKTRCPSRTLSRLLSRKRESSRTLTACLTFQK
jgi:hypothetical protein